MLEGSHIHSRAGHIPADQSMTHRKLAGLGLLLALAATAADDAKRDPAVGQSYQVPYRRTQTNHALVRIRINGKGPFNFLVDTGAPALYIGTDVARKIGMEPSKTEFFNDVDRIDFEGGAYLTRVKGRVEDPFQLTGMNAMGLPGATIDGILGFNVLARFRMEFDPTKDRMTWTRLDYEPKDLVIPQPGPGDGPPAEVQAMGLLGPMIKGAVRLGLINRQPEERLLARGFLGMELSGAEGGVRVDRVLPESPAAAAGVREDDLLIRVLKADVNSLKAAHEAVAKVRPGDRVALTVRRGEETAELTATADKGF
jgi:hypothetical protein